MAIDATLKIELEPVVKLGCSNFNCKFNLWDNPRSEYACCNMKLIELDKDGVCMNKQQKEREIK